MKVVFRDNNPEVAGPVAAAFPEWDVACRNIYGDTVPDEVAA